MNAPRTEARSGRRRAAGFTLLAVLIAVATMAGLVAVYGRHVLVVARGGLSSPSLDASREACLSGLAFARQTLVAGQPLASGPVPACAMTADVVVLEAEPGQTVVAVQAQDDDGYGVRRMAALALQPVPPSAPDQPAALPTLSAEAVAALLADPSVALREVTSSERIEHTELSGLVVLHPGVDLELSDVVLRGALVSASVLQGATYGPYDAFQAPRAIVDGNLRIDPHPALPGVAIVMPDGAVRSGAVDARVQIHGDVVAHDVSLLHPGVLAGQVVAVDVELADPSVLDRVGGGRKPHAWSDALELGDATEPVTVAIVPASTTVGELSEIITYWQQDSAP